MIKRLLAVWHARNLEFLRDRPTLLFTLLLPLGVVIGMGFVFGGPPRPLFKVGLLGPSAAAAANPFLHERYVQFVPMRDEASGSRGDAPAHRPAPRSRRRARATGSTPTRPRATSWRSSSSPPIPARAASR